MNGKIRVGDEFKSPHEIRQQLYENVVEESMFISRASEGSVSLEWIMGQPIFIRKKYLDQFTKELKEREANLKKNSKG